MVNGASFTRRASVRVSWRRSGKLTVHLKKSHLHDYTKWDNLEDIDDEGPLTPGPRGSVQRTQVASGLPHFQRFAQDCKFAQQLVTEAEAGHRKAALRIFFEGADSSLEEMMKPHNCLPPSEHQPGREGFLKILVDKCKSLVALGGAGRIVVHHEDSGFFSAFLVVLDVLLMASPETEISVKWQLTGDEKHFTCAPSKSRMPADAFACARRL